MKFELDLAAFIMKNSMTYTIARPMTEFIKTWFQSTNKFLGKAFLDREKSSQINRYVYSPKIVNILFSKLKKNKWSYISDIYSKGKKRLFGMHLSINEIEKKRVGEYFYKLVDVSLNSTAAKLQEIIESTNIITDKEIS
jgi:hypothetical protein